MAETEPSTPDSGTPIFDELLARRRAEPQFRHANGQPCHGCQICLAEADVDDDQADPKEKA